MIRLVLTIPGAALRAGLRSLLDADPAFQVIRASQRPEGLEQADVWVVTEGFSAEDIHREIVSVQADVALLVLGDGTRSTARYQNLPVRAWGILPIEATVEEMTAAIQALDAGLIVIYPHWAELPRSHRAVPLGEVEPLVEPLTERETEVLQLLSQGLSNKQIAVRLHISEHTVKFHVSSIYGKLGATNRAEAVRLGAQQGLVVL